MNDVDLVGVIEDVRVIEQGQRKTWAVDAIIAGVVAKVPAERALMGQRMHLRYDGVLLAQLALKRGILFQVQAPLALVNAALDLIAEGKEAPLRFQPLFIRPMAEPCVRVPLSLLRELRGQEIGTEYSRRALVSLWDAKDANDKNARGGIPS
jgi:hypothetical protein